MQSATRYDPNNQYLSYRLELQKTTNRARLVVAASASTNVPVRLLLITFKVYSWYRKFHLVTMPTAIPTSSTPLLSNLGTSSGPTPLPWKPLLVVLLLTASQPMALDIIFPFVNQMILDNGIVERPEDVGFYSGIVMAIYPVMGFLASTFETVFFAKHIQADFVD